MQTNRAIGAIAIEVGGRLMVAYAGFCPTSTLIRIERLMETSLHKQLKLRYAATESQIEIPMGCFRVDAITSDAQLIEIQHASLGAMREKTRKMLEVHKSPLRIVKPIVARKTIVTLDRVGGDEIRRRLSPKRGDLLDIFLDLVHFGDVFPHPRLKLELLLIEAEEIRIDREPTRHRGKRYKCLDQRLVEIQSSVTLHKLVDLVRLLPLQELPPTFDTAQLASAIAKPRWFAQKVAYCFRKSGAAKMVGKRGNSQLYRLKPQLKRSTRVA